jgi:peptide deformylase
VSLLPISVLGAPILRVETTPVAVITDELQRLIDEMFETMYAAQGIGLAAPQVGRSERLAVVDVLDNPLVIINPEIVREEGSERGEEGCLSIPDIYGDVDRAKRVLVRSLDRDGKPFEIDASELLARCLQHEIDHLHGRLFIDYLSFLKRRATLAKWEVIKSRYPTLLRHLTPEELRAARAERERHPDEQI